MTETKETDESQAPGDQRKPLTVIAKRTVDTAVVRQNFPQGRSKPVLVERKKRRIVPPTPGASSTQAASPAPAPAAPPTASQTASAAPRAEEAAPRRRSGVERSNMPSAARGASDGLTRKLSDAEKEARLRALAAAKAREADDRRRAEEEMQRRAEEDRRRALEAAAKKREEEEEARRRAEEAEREAEGASQSETAAQTAVVAPLEGTVPTDPVGARQRSAPAERVPVAKARTAEGEDEERGGDRAKRPLRREAERPPTPPKREDDRRTRGRLTINNAFDESQRERSLASLRRRQERQKAKSMGALQAREKISREVVIPEVITIQELANRMAERAVDVIRFLMKQGEMFKMNDVIDTDTAELVAQEFGHTVRRVSAADVEEGFIGAADDEGDRRSRPPVVTIMGHVDHGKTSLLDAIRHANVVAGEAGGITQHIGAYQVKTPSGALVTFIDTPGHEAFTAMRARGAKVTDIVVLVVAADDGVMPQTIEAIRHARAAGVPMIVAINKIDKPDADPNKVRMALLQHEVVVESLSGETLEVEVSALKQTGIDTLLEAIAMQSELLELRANPERTAEGIVVEAKLERGRGPVGTLLVQRGTLRVGNIVVAGTSWGRVRALIDDKGGHIVEAGPSTPVEVLGFNSAPEAGDQFAVVENESRARELTEYRESLRRDKLAGGATVRSLEQMMSKLKDAGRQEFPLLVKADVQGSAEAIAGALEKLGTDEVGARILHSGVGGVTESDISLAAASNAVIIAFNVRANQQARAAAEREGVEIRQYAIIYDVVDDVKSAMSGMLAPTIRENFLGNASILEIFNITKVGKVAGCRVTEGRVERGANVRLIRDNVVIHEGKLSTLKRFKDEVKEVQVGQECGMAFEGYQDMRAGDVIECFTTEKVKRSL
ncbi:MAG: translation initiation factor IF-2 [Rhizobiales bacterium]|nr:translation initiation factor IF-2 [Hyphomicrobiales bacterium]